MNEITIEYTPDEIWKPFYADEWDLSILIGGRGSGKTWNTGNRVAIRTHENPNKRTLVLRDVATSIEQSILQNIKDRFTVINEKSGGQYSRLFEVQESQIKNLVENKVILFTKGFRQSRVGQSADLKGFEDLDEAIIEEAEDLRDEERVNTLLDTMRKEGYKVTIILNTPDLEHWIIKRYFDWESTEYKGYYKLKPKNIKGVLQIIVNYKDNKHLPQKTRAKYDAYGDPTSHLYNPDYYAGKILGLASKNQHNQYKFDIDVVAGLKPQQPIQIIDGVKIYQKPQANQIYSIGIDPSSGLGNDWSCLSMRNFYTGKVVAQLKGKIREREMARMAVNLANWYNNAGGKVYIACEINGLGRAVQNMIQDTYDENLIYKRYIQDPTKQYDTLIPDLGFQTTAKNRDLIINNFVYAFADGKVDMINQDEIDEAKTFIWNTERNRYEAQEGGNDDILFSDFICFDNFNYIRQYG